MNGSEAFDPYTPLNVLKPIAAGVWIVDGPEIQFSYLGLRFPLQTRMTLIRLPNGGLWIHSPTSLTDALAGKVLEAGPVLFLIAPNTLHYWWIPDWKTRFPDAMVYAAPGLERSAKRPLPVDQVLGNVPPPAWAGIIDQAVVRGDMLTEGLLPLPVTHPCAYRSDRELRAETDPQPILSAFAAPRWRRRP